MRFIKKEDIENYRFAIAKKCFLDIYDEYSLVSDIPKSNCFIARDKNYTHFIISIFKLPTIEIEEEYPVICFYQKGRNPSDNKKQYRIEHLDNDFTRHNRDSFEMAILAPDDFINQLAPEYITLFKGLLLNEDILKRPDVPRYKYYARDSVDTNAHQIVDGCIYFADPNTFNDPFDVNCFFANSTDISRLFRIFCVAPNPREILMWSYYSTNHEGYCFEYSDREILQAMAGETRACLGIIGEVTYSKTRPNQKSSLSRISFSEIDFYARAAFTKYEEWSHEKEYRYVLLLNDFYKDEYFKYDVNIKNMYQGCALPLKTVTDSAGGRHTPVQITKDNTAYKLN